MRLSVFRNLVLMINWWEYLLILKGLYLIVQENTRIAKYKTKMLIQKNLVMLKFFNYFMKNNTLVRKSSFIIHSIVQTYLLIKMV